MPKRRRNKKSGQPKATESDVYVSHETSFDTGPTSWQAEHFPTSVYRDGPNNTIEIFNSEDGEIPSEDWKDTPAKCKNTGAHVKVD